jgi:predicted O-linked N-acetylglucosamine transferase (SPINDLY family)
VESHRRALQINPGFAEAHFSLGNALYQLGRLDEALASYRRTLELKPGFADAHNNLGNVLANLERFQDAADSYGSALELKPDLAEAHTRASAAAQTALGLHDRAAASIARALAINPGFAEAHFNLAIPCTTLALDEAIASLPPSPADKTRLRQGLYRTVLLAQATTRRQVRNRCLPSTSVRCPVRLAAGTEQPRHRNVRDPDRCLRIGFVSADFRDHAIATFIETGAGATCGTTCAVAARLLQHPVEDGTSARLRRYFKDWTPTVRLSDADHSREKSKRMESTS